MRAFFFSMILVWSTLAFASEPISCDCEMSACAPCEVETGVSFYSAKCGVGGAKIKSCKKPSCAAVEDQPICLAKLGLPSAPATAREPASTHTAPNDLVLAGEVVETEGAASIVRGQNGSLEKPTEKLAVYVGDLIETKMNGKVRILLRDRSETVIAPNTRLKIDAVAFEANRRRVRLDLLSGRVRNRVSKKLEKESSFEVRTRTAVAGVRGTDFVTTYELGDKEWVSEVRTIEGLVHLSGTGSASAKTVDIPAGTYAALVIGPPSRRDDEDEFFKSLEKASITPVIKMSPEETEALRRAPETSMPGDVAASDSASVKREPTATAAAGGKDDEVCQGPVGRFKQCSFTCEGNPRGDKTCRTELPGVACVRRLCGANGVWSDQRRLPSSYSEQCVPGRSVVRECGSYW